MAWVVFYRAGLGVVTMHAAYVVVETGVLVYLAESLRAEAVSAPSELESMVSNSDCNRWFDRFVWSWK